MSKNIFVYDIEPHCNSGEGVSITTIIEDGEIREQNIEIMSYGNSCTMHLFRNILTPEILRSFANKLENVLTKNNMK